MVRAARATTRAVRVKVFILIVGRIESLVCLFEIELAG